MLVDWGKYLLDLPSLPKKYAKAIDRVQKEALVNMDFETNPLPKKPEHLQHTATTWNEIQDAWEDIHKLPKEEQCDGVTTFFTKLSDFLASPNFQQKKYSVVREY